jgi:hypothetical protein
MLKVKLTLLLIKQDGKIWALEMGRACSMNGEKRNAYRI